MEAVIADKAPLFVETSVARVMASRMHRTHVMAGISVFSGPWGLGKTTTIKQFADEIKDECLVIKVEATKRGASPAAIMNQIADEFGRRYHWHHYIPHTTDQTRLRRLMAEFMGRAFGNDPKPRFTIIFDEAQYLSRMAIEMLRFWNDSDRPSLGFPVGLIFVGNNEFALEESLGGESVLSGAVRSRLLFEVELSYDLLTDKDLELFAQSRGIVDHDALAVFVDHFSQSRIKRDLRRAERLLAECHERANGRDINANVIRLALGL